VVSTQLTPYPVRSQQISGEEQASQPEQPLVQPTAGS
jgi:hypothetical protein